MTEDIPWHASLELETIEFDLEVITYHIGLAEVTNHELVLAYSLD